MMVSRWFGLAVLGLWCVSAGCTTLREIPSGEYAAAPERKSVRVTTRDGLVYEFDYATFDADSLSGFRSRSDLEGTIGQVVEFRIPLENIQRMTTRSVDWYRTGLVGGSIIAGVIAVGISQATRGADAGGSTSPGPKPCNTCTPNSAVGAAHH